MKNSQNMTTYPFFLGTHDDLDPFFPKVLAIYLVWKEFRENRPQVVILAKRIDTGLFRSSFIDFTVIGWLLKYVFGDENYQLLLTYNI